jgi:hypothetical protein
MRMWEHAGWRASGLGRWLGVVGAEEAELVTASCFENESERGGVSTAAARGAARFDVADAILDAMVNDCTPVGGDNVAVPVHVLAVGELCDESSGTVARITGVS